MIRQSLPVLDNLVKAAVLSALPLLAVGIYLTWDEFQSLLEVMRAGPVTRAFMLTGQALLVINVLALAWRIALVMGYRPAPECADEDLPDITIIVPAYNEGRQVLQTLRSLIRSDYPAEKMQIIAVDDGSRDDTWQWLKQASDFFPGRIQLIRCPVNKGKRNALYRGIRRSRGQVLVTVDSDSEVETQTLRRLVGPFVADPKVGAVAGNVRVLNRSAGIIPRMLEVSFTYSFNFIRASQSRVNTVMCTPGALSAYRRCVAEEVLDEWLNQRFCGRPANIGEDRAMTNLILRSGYHVLFQRDAAVLTKVPTGYRGLCRMLLRWARSNIRETIVLTRFAFRRFRTTPAAGARINLLLHLLGMTVPQVLRASTAVFLFVSPLVFGLHLLLGMAVVATIPALVYRLHFRNGNWFWAYPFALFWLAGLAWIAPYALLTPHKTGWLTRDLPAAAKTHVVLHPVKIHRAA
jgi:hyaluronan synthase